MTTDAVCAVCGKSVVKAPLGFASDVREGDKTFHIECYRLYKRQAPPA
jgi:hypothetical protein